ncbi:MAG: HemK2/MTQ2 family protein methyltransferase [Candidatus Thorarchaeota archaeon]
MRKTIDGLKIDIPKEVYDPAEDSFLLAENVFLKENQKILEVGSGSGYVSIFLSQKFPNNEFFCLDINFYAAQITKKNSSSNNESIEVINSDLFTSFKKISKSEGLFDIILFNTPYLPVIDDGILAQAWSGGKDGLGVISRFIEKLSDYLKKSGSCYLVVSSYTNLQELMKQITNQNLISQRIDQVIVSNEHIILYKISFKN